MCPFGERQLSSRAGLNLFCKMAAKSVSNVMKPLCSLWEAVSAHPSRSWCLTAHVAPVKRSFPLLEGHVRMKGEGWPVQYN